MEMRNLSSSSRDANDQNLPNPNTPGVTTRANRSRTLSSAEAKESVTSSTPSGGLHGTRRNDYCNISMGEMGILKELDQASGYGVLGESMDTRVPFCGENVGNIATVAADETRQRKASVASEAYESDLFSPSAAAVINFRKRLRLLIAYLIPQLYFRLSVYSLIFLFVSALIAAGNLRPAVDWLILYFASVLLELIASIIDRIVYWLIDFVFGSSMYNVAYLLHSVNGPLGSLLTILVMRNYFDDYLGASETFPSFDTWIGAFTVIVICNCIKNWITRQQYVYMLEKRFTNRLAQLETWLIVISEMACTRPPKRPSSDADLTPMNIIQTQQQNERGMKNFGRGTSVCNIPNFTEKVRDVFIDLVAPEDGADEGNLFASRREIYERRRSFWMTAFRLHGSAGTMPVVTYNGMVTICSQYQARFFGKQLYRHISKGGRHSVDRNLLYTLIREGREAEASHRAGRKTADNQTNETSARYLPDSYQEEIEFLERQQETLHLYEQATIIFDPEGKNKITEDDVVNGILTVYKEQRFAAASISDFSVLYRSLGMAIDVLYWVIMVFVLQSFFGFLLTDYLLPFITLLLSLSFTVSSVAGSYFTAFSFVFFMIPFDIGHRVQVKLWPVSVEGFVKSITLQHTTLTSMLGETMKIPNHILFNAPIFNLTETTGAVYEFIVHLNTNTAQSRTADQELVDEFFNRLRKYALEETNGEWTTFLISPGRMDTREGSMEYKIYCTHRQSWHYFYASSAARVTFYHKMKQLQSELDIHFMKIAIPVDIQGQNKKNN